MEGGGYDSSRYSAADHERKIYIYIYIYSSDFYGEDDHMITLCTRINNMVSIN